MSKPSARMTAHQRLVCLSSAWNRTAYGKAGRRPCGGRVWSCNRSSSRPCRRPGPCTCRPFHPFHRPSPCTCRPFHLFHRPSPCTCRPFHPFHRPISSRPCRRSYRPSCRPTSSPCKPAVSNALIPTGRGHECLPSDLLAVADLPDRVLVRLGDLRGVVLVPSPVAITVGLLGPGAAARGRRGVVADLERRRGGGRGDVQVGEDRRRGEGHEGALDEGGLGEHGEKFVCALVGCGRCWEV
ncbi:hypothetical protein LXA43DRAFT_326460 [Ganoderma leucocontextum]|nr:hypothetical protein LXA43DRAFT_326460 [Ganoderma leucocontextum]